MYVSCIYSTLQLIWTLLCFGNGRFYPCPTRSLPQGQCHYLDVIMSGTAYLITWVSTVCLTVCPGADQRKHQNSMSLAFVRGIHRRPVNSTQRASNAENISIWWRIHDHWGKPRNISQEYIIISLLIITHHICAESSYHSYIRHTSNQMMTPAL